MAKKKTKTKKAAKKTKANKKATKRQASKKKPSRRDDEGETGNDAADATRLYAPDGGATVRFYRIGHGDCFLIAFASDSPKNPVYVLIDCGYKPGSPGKLKEPTRSAEIWENIRSATGGHIDVAVITHEHQDHVNGITVKNLGDITIGETWLAWTENPEDDLANHLRKIYRDKLVGLVRRGIGCLPPAICCRWNMSTIFWSSSWVAMRMCHSNSQQHHRPSLPEVEVRRTRNQCRC